MRLKLLQDYRTALRAYSAAVSALDRDLCHEELQAGLDRAKRARMQCEECRMRLDDFDRPSSNARAAGED